MTRDSLTVTPDELRTTLAEVYPRAGWKARNLDAFTGRVYDLVDYRSEDAWVEWDWDNTTVSGYFQGHLVFDSPAHGESGATCEDAFKVVEEYAARYLTEQRKADPYYQEQEARRGR